MEDQRIMQRQRDTMFNAPVEEYKERSKVSSDEWKEWTKTVWSIANVSDSVHPAVFPIEIPYRLIRLFSFYGELVVDPFSGMGTTAKAALLTGRSYCGFETNPEYAEIAKLRLHEFTFANKCEATIDEARIICQSCESMHQIEDDSVGAVITSPPYWNKANYGECEGNIGGYEYYDDYLEHMRSVFQECYRILMPGRKLCFVVANVNQNTKEYGLVTMPIASDLTKIAQECGYSLVNQIIWSKDGTGGKWGSSASQRPIFGSYPYPPNFLFKNVNEYIVIVQKPIKNRKGSAPSYSSFFRNNPRSSSPS